MEDFICKHIDVSEIRLNNGNIVRPEGFGILLFSSGKGKVTCNDIAYHLEEHILFVFTPFSTFYLEEGVDDMEGWLLEADVKTALMLLEDIPAQRRVTISQYPCVKITQRQEDTLKGLMQIMRCKMDEDNSHPLIDNLHKKVLFLLRQTIILEVIHVYFDSPQVSGMPLKRGNALFSKFISSVYDNCGEHRTVAFYARQQNLSTGRFSAVVREVSGKSPMQWIELFTMTKIRKMLSTTSASIKEITDSMGFPDQSTFGRYFKSREGMSPSEYRARQSVSLSSKAE